MENEKRDKKGPKECQRLLSKMLMKKSNELYARTGTQRWKSFLPYLQFPIWLTAIETIRRMAGAPEGLVGLVQKSVTWNEPEDPLFDRKETKARSTSPENGLQNEDLEDPLSVDDSMPSNVLDAPVVPVEASLATEGMLWFPDLLLPDPQLYLPFILSAILFVNIAHVQSTARKLGAKQTAFQRRLGNTFKIVAFAVGPMTLSMPSAIHLYWISSSVCALGYNMLMNWYSPITKGVQPCKERRFERHTVEQMALMSAKAKEIREARDRKEKEKHQTR
ncbi:MAG: hypothetical protein Q9166_002203 [cf. Caloplaca sp. 2 TL-2023]